METTRTEHSVQDVAKAFKAALDVGDYPAAEAFWAEDVVSIENMEGPRREARGLAAVKAKSEWWFSAHEVHAFSVEGPFVNADQFALGFQIDVTNKETSQRIRMGEVGLYTVRDGKIVEERFFY